MKKCILLVLSFMALTLGLYAQIPDRDTPYFTLGAGLGTSNVLVDGESLEITFFEPKISLSPSFMLGSKNIIHLSSDKIISIETQAFLRWKFLRLGGRSSWATTDIFIQGGIGLLGAFKNNAVWDSHDARASLVFDATAGVTIPLGSRWYLEPSVRAGYPFMGGVSVTAGMKFPLTRRSPAYQETQPRIETRIEYIDHEVEVVRTEYVEIFRTLPPSEIVRRILITQVEYIIFAPDISRYNYRLDHDAESLNNLVLDHTAGLLRDNPDFRVRLEGHANPVTRRPGETEELLALSEARANEVALQLRQRGVSEEQIIVIAYGGARLIAGAEDHDHWNMNRRVEMIVIQVDVN